MELNAARLFDSAAGRLRPADAWPRICGCCPSAIRTTRLYETLAWSSRHLEDPAAAGELVVRFELLLLDELGFGLDLSDAPPPARRDDLAYVSPKSGRAVSRAAGAPWGQGCWLCRLSCCAASAPARRARPSSTTLSG